MKKILTLEGFQTLRGLQIFKSTHNPTCSTYLNTNEIKDLIIEY